MILRRFPATALLAAFWAFCAAPSSLSAEEEGKALTAGGHAWAEVRRALVKDGMLHLELRFLTDYVGYSGEKIYEGIPPEKLELSFNYDPQRNPRVGEWRADFVAPEQDVAEAWLHMPNMAPIGPFPISRR